MGTAYSQTLSATGGKTPYTWSITSGTLPAGLTLNAGTGAITGTPTAAGSGNFTIQVRDANNTAAAKTLSITVNAAPLSITTSGIADGYVGAGYSQSLAAIGGTQPYTWSITTGTLPAGLTLGSTGVVSGTPTAGGTSTFTVQVADNNSATATRSFTITVYAAPPIPGTVDVATLFPPGATIQTNHFQTLTISATNNKIFDLKTYHAEFSYPAGLAITILSINPYTVLATVNTTKHLIIFEWSSVAPGTTLTASFSVSGPAPGTYNISPTNLYYTDSSRQKYIGSCNMTQITVQPDLEAPSSPRNVKSISGEGSINVYWSQVADEDVIGFNIYRRTPTTTFVKMNTQLIDPYSTWFSDTSIQNGLTYYYALKAVDASGNESLYSVETGETYFDLKIKTYSASGPSATAVGDINGDGNPDIAFGYPGYCSRTGGTPICEGKVEVHFGGNTSGNPDVILLGENGADYDWNKFGNAVAVVDLNNDGFDELVVGAPEHDSTPTGAYTDQGKVYAYAGGPQFSVTPVFTMDGNLRASSSDGYYYTAEELGFSIAAGGDINGDGYQDVVIGAPYGGVNRGGSVVTLYGGPELSSLSTSRINSGGYWKLLGSSVAVGDIYNDGYSDILAGAPANSLYSSAGHAYVYSSGPEYQGTKDFSNGNSGFGSSISVIGDFNGDGYADVALNNYIYYGGPAMDTYQDIILHGGVNKILPLGDVNGDGLADIATVDPKVYFGNRNDQFIPDISRQGMTLLTTGDMDNDGLKDMVVSDQSAVHVYSIAQYLILPQISVSSPKNTSGTGSTNSTILGTVKGTFAKFQVGGQNTSIMPDNTFSAHVSLTEGENSIEILGETPEGKISKRTLTVTYSPLIQPLIASITLPTDNATVYTRSITVTGTISDPAARVTVNGVLATISGNTFTTAAIPIHDGSNTISALAVDSYYQMATHTVTVNYVLAYGSVNGTVIDNVTGNPVVAASISITDAIGQQFSTTTDIAGNYSIVNVNVGSFAGTVSRDGYTTGTISGSVPPEQAVFVGVALVPYGKVTGTILDATINIPLSNERITIRDKDNFNHISYTASDGTYSVLNIPPGSITTYVGSNGYYGQVIPGIVYPGATTVVDASLSPSGVVVIGIVTDILTGEPVALATVFMYFSNSCNNAVVTDNSGTYRMYCDVGGSFSGNITANDYLTANISGYAPVWQTTIINYNLRPANGVISGRVTDAVSGLPIPSAVVSITDALNITHNTTADGSGDYIIDNVAAGAFSGTVTKAGYSTGTIQGTASNGQATTVNVSLAAYVSNGSIRGTVTDASTGLPISSASVSVTDSTSVVHSASTLIDGTYTIADIPPGVFNGTINKGGYSSAVIYGTAVSGQATVADAALTPVLPIISNIQVNDITSGTANILWTTDQPTDGRVDYGITMAYDNAAYSALQTTAHSMFLSNLTPGRTYHFRITSTNGYGFSSSSVDKTFNTVGPITLSISYPPDNSTFTQSYISIEGAVTNSLGNETGVVVNGVVATVYGNQFVANHVPLQEGPNTVTVTATDTAGFSTTNTETVEALSGYPYITVTSDTIAGLPPMEATIRVAGNFYIANSSIEAYGPPSSIEWLSSGAIEYKVRMTNVGIYRFTVSVTGYDSEVYQDFLNIVVLDEAQIDGLLRGKWYAMRDKLSTGDNTAALNYIHPSARPKYQAIFSVLSGQLPAIVANETNLDLISVTDHAAEYRLGTLEGGTQFGYEVIFGQDDNGIWKILKH